MRLKRHNSGQVLHTAKWKPWRPKTYVGFSDRSRAVQAGKDGLLTSDYRLLALDVWFPLFCLSASVRHLVLLENDHPLVPGQQPAENPSTVAVTKALLPEVVIKKAQARTKRSLQCEFL